MAESSSSQPFSSRIQPQYDVFVSFRGEDVRNTFLSHLQAALKRKGITIFFDEELRRGEEISPALLKAIEQSSISIVIFSQNYASSRWCLDELLKILQCRSINRQIVMPIFYHVDPSHVRKQTGSYAEALSKHEETSKNRKDNIQRWKDALMEIASLSGWDLDNGRPESEIIDRITKEILKIVDSLTLMDAGGLLVGIERRVERIESSLCLESNDVRILGIWGMGGIGKTTVAKALFHKIKNQFDGCCFLENVREDSGKNGHRLPDLRKKLLSKVMEEKQPHMDISCTFLRKRLCGKKVLIVLDDIDDIEQLENLVGRRDWFGEGSRIIITTKNRQLLTEAGKVYDYATEQLTDEEALLLFSHHAFKSRHPPQVYLELSKKIVNYACGIPLALKLLGSCLRKKDKKTWESALTRLERFSDDKIIKKVLELSFEGLNTTEKNILLDIACFFKGEDVKFATSIWDVCGFFPDVGLSVLSDMCLIYLRNNSQLWMHDLIQEMSKAIVRKESTEPGERSRLWEAEDIFHVFRENTGTSTIQCMLLNLSETNEVLELGDAAFAKMEKLRLLKFFIDLDESTKIRLPRGLTMLPGSLTLFFWDRYPNKFLTSRFDLPNLVGLFLRHSCISQLWKGHRMFKHLKHINLNNSKCLSEIPDLSGAQCLEDIDSHGCTNLTTIHHSISTLSRLTYLNLSDCRKLRNLASNICLKRLERLILSGCSNLQTFPTISDNMEHLYELSLDGTGVSNLPSSIEKLTGLVEFNLSNCKKLVRLPENICNLKCLQSLILSGCENLQHLPENIGNLESLSWLWADGTSIQHAPSSIINLKNISTLSFRGCRGMKPSTNSHWVSSWFPIHRRRSSDSTISGKGLQLPPLGGFQNLKRLSLSNCNLVEVPSGLDNLPSLSYLDLSENNFEILPQTIFYNIPRLDILVLSNCTRLRSLPELPPSLRFLLADECSSLESIMSFKSLLRGIGEWNRKEFKFANCLKLKNQCSNILESIVEGVHLAERTVQKLYDQGICHGGLHLTLGVIYPGGEIPEWFGNQTMGDTVTLHLPPHCLDKSLGFAVCVIISPEYTFHSYVNVHFRLMFQDEVQDTDPCGYHILRGGRSKLSFKDDHVVFGFTSMSEYIVSADLWPKNRNHIECIVKFGACSDGGAVVKLKKCAVRLLNVEGKTQPTFNSSSLSLHYDQYLLDSFGQKALQPF